MSRPVPATPVTSRWMTPGEEHLPAGYLLSKNTVRCVAHVAKTPSSKQTPLIASGANCCPCPHSANCGRCGAGCSDTREFLEGADAGGTRSCFPCVPDAVHAASAGTTETKESWR